MVVEEVVDEPNQLVIRRITVGPLETNCYALHAPRSRHAILVDPGGEPDAILDAVTDLQVSTVVLTHTHGDHVEAVAQVVDATGAPVAAHLADTGVWQHERRHLESYGHWDAGTATADLLHAGCPPHPTPGQLLWDGVIDIALHDGEALTAGPLDITVAHTPGHTPGGITLTTPGHAFTGDTLFPGGPGLTGWPFSDFPTIISSIRSKLLTLPDDTLVHPGHGNDTRIGDERPDLQTWIRRGW